VFALLAHTPAGRHVHFLLVTSDPIARYEAQRGARGLAVERLNSNETVDAALRVYQRHGITFLRVTAVPSLFCLAALAFVLEYVLPGLGSTTDPNSIAVQAAEVLVTLALAIFVGGPVFLTGLTYGSAVVVRMTSDLLEGRPSSEIQALRAAREALPRLFWLNLRELLLSLSGIIVSTAFMLLGSFLTTVTSSDTATAGVVAAVGILGLVLGVFIFLAIATRHALALPIAVVEGLRGRECARRSLKLLNRPKTGKRFPGNPAQNSAFGTIYGVYILLLFIGVVFIVSLETVVLLLGVSERVGSWLAGSWLKPLVVGAIDLAPLYATIWVLIPAWAATLTVVYYRRRVLLEGYDIEALGRQTNEDRANRFNV
jgi:hypothetical protein